MEIRPVTEAEFPLACALVAELQADPEHHICYLSMRPDDIAEDFRDKEPLGERGVLVAADGDRLLGAMGTEWGEQPPRAWWHGPFVFDRANDPDAIADALLAAGRALLPETVTQQELGPDDRNTLIAALARRSGFHPDEASVVLQRRALGGDGPPADGARITPLTDDDRADVTALHDDAFAGAHLTGQDVDKGDDRLVLVARDDAGSFLGYVAANRESDGSGYIDFLAVTPTARGRGVGAALVEGACAQLRATFGCEEVNLTVRESNAAARRLYAKLGFEEERLIRPWRIGFSLGRAPESSGLG